MTLQYGAVGNMGATVICLCMIVYYRDSLAVKQFFGGFSTIQSALLLLRLVQMTPLPPPPLSCGPDPTYISGWKPTVQAYILHRLPYQNKVNHVVYISKCMPMARIVQSTMLFYPAEKRYTEAFVLHWVNRALWIRLMYILGTFLAYKLKVHFKGSMITPSHQSH